ncbi:efflux RND transporter periplasmic adaptor subunit [Aquabacterium sp.]|jgi:membrane fusion protein, multidrug efflux system|uniref:efflux RND transporter periplasmic adaptor subunit n=1 Tax=Aquabacterium sp. TaxID=1872578 RepID=UPI00248A3AEF|nr:efflux RND transporter periplasmic adaptor subunit [Aquabacterium sp.]MDI1350456.1 efflux RND transporter periplasmic adaptor subunit [Aquabacterium sp.]
MSQPTPTAPEAAPAAAPGRKKALTLVAAAVVLGGIGYGAYYALVANHFEHTDNAYVQANVVQITPQVAGTVVAIAADDTDKVKAGQVLVKLDQADARVALDQAQAQLAQTVREVRTLFANNGSLEAQIRLRQADVTRTQTEVARAQDDVNRRAPLLASGAVGKEEYNHATAQLAAARSAQAGAESALSAAREQLMSNQSLTDGTTVDQHPNVARAAARVRETYLALQRAALPAPVDGYVAKRSVQVGQRVQAGSPVMALVTLDQPWVDANFKESQLQRIRIGQPATLTADVYGQKVTYHGKVVGLGAGTGAAFSLLPAQNATGNWIKVVQRVPVRLSLDEAEVKAHPLRVGLSMEVEVDVAQQDGPVLAQNPREHAVAQTAVFDALQKDADALVRRIIDANLGRARAAPAAHAVAPTAARPGV